MDGGLGVGGVCIYIMMIGVMDCNERSSSFFSFFLQAVDGV
jgi:hypothetical protein